MLPVAGRATVTALGMTSPGVKLRAEVAGVPVAVPGRMERKPAAVGAMAVMLSKTPVAPGGTTILLVVVWVASV